MKMGNGEEMSKWDAKKEGVCEIRREQVHAIST